jgi:hypothetical protein
MKWFIAAAVGAALTVAAQHYVRFAQACEVATPPAQLDITPLFPPSQPRPFTCSMGQTAMGQFTLECN